VTGLFLSLRPVALIQPLAQMKALQVWNEEAQKAYLDLYGELDGAHTAFRNLWSWSPILTSPLVEARNRAEPSHLFQQARTLGIDFFTDYTRLKTSGRAKQIEIHWPDDFIITESLPDAYQAIPDFVSAELMKDFRKTPHVTSEERPYLPRAEDRALSSVSWTDYFHLWDKNFYYIDSYYDGMVFYPNKDMAVIMETSIWFEKNMTVYSRIGMGEWSWKMDYSKKSNDRYFLLAP
jgi:hypothetical protein